jgi:hypothetical protein
MKVIVSQRFDYASIDVAHNYTPLCLRDTLIELNGDRVPWANKLYMRINTYRIPDTRAAYFGKECGGQNISLVNAGKHVNTCRDKHIKRFYADPFASIALTTEIREVKMRDEKTVTIRIYSRNRGREKFHKFFKKGERSTFISINLETGNFTTGFTNKGGRANNTLIRRNHFADVDNVLRNLLMKPSYAQDKLGQEAFNDAEFLKAINECLGFFTDGYIEYAEKSQVIRAFIVWLTKFFVEKKKIKTPNVYGYLLMEHYPTEVHLKKNGRKLMQSVLAMYGVNSKFAVKTLHKYGDKCLGDLVRYGSLLGADYPKYLQSVSAEFFTRAHSTDKVAIMDYKLSRRNGEYSTYAEYALAPFEKENVVKVINNLVGDHQEAFGRSSSNGEFFGLLVDHFKMINTIRSVLPDTYMNATTYKQFAEEHDWLSKTTRLIKKGYTLEYVFDARMINSIETPLTDPSNPENVLYPLVLKREDDYKEEGSFMHHCVATYVDNNHSLIVSLRTGDGKDRVTIEYNNKSGIQVQARHFCNAQAPEKFWFALELLKAKVHTLGKSRLLTPIDKIRVPVRVNGVEVNIKVPEVTAGSNDLWLQPQQPVQVFLPF